MPESPVRCDGTAECITCSDAADLVRLEAIDAGGIGWCVDPADPARRRSEVMLDLVPAARVGSHLLVHAGVALLLAAAPATCEDASE